MQFDGLIETLRVWMETVRSWVLEQTWLGFIHDWILKAPASNIWAVFVVSLAAIILLIGFLPYGKAKQPPPV